MKRLISVLLCLCIMFTLLPTTALAADENAAEGEAPAPVCACDPQVEEGGVHTNAECPFYIAPEKTAGEAAAELFSALPAAESITADSSDEERAAALAKLEEAMAALEALTEEEQALFMEEHEALYRAAMALNDAITGAVPMKSAPTPFTLSAGDAVSVTFDGTETGYATIDAAWAAAIACATTADEKAVIKLLTDTSTAANSLTNAEDYLTLNTNGKTLTFTATGSASRVMSSGGSLDITGGGAIQGQSDSYGPGVVEVSGGSGSLTDATIENTGKGSAFYASGSGKFTICSGALKTGGEICVKVQSSATCTMRGGSVTGFTYYGVYVYGGTFCLSPDKDKTILVQNDASQSSQCENLLYAFSSGTIELKGDGAVKLAAAPGTTVNYGVEGTMKLTKGTLEVDMGGASSTKGAFSAAPTLTTGSSMTVTAGDASPGNVVEAPVATTYTGSKYVSIAVLPATYTCNTPAAITVNGVTAAVTYSPAGPQPEGASVIATVTLTGTATAVGTHTVNLTSAGVSLAGASRTTEVTAGRDLTVVQVTETFTFTVPGKNVDDLVLAHAFATKTGQVWNGTSATYFDGGTGTEADPYQIRTAEQLCLLSAVINRYDYSGATPVPYTDALRKVADTQDVQTRAYLADAYYELTADIVLNDTTNWESWSGTTKPTNSWKPIGAPGNYCSFLGVFDGGGHTVSGMYFSDTTGQAWNGAANGDRVGLFAAIKGSEIKNVTVKESYIKGGPPSAAWLAILKTAAK